MLPLILSFLGSGAAGAGLLGGLSPLIAGAVGSGLGTAIETGDIGKGLQAGLLGGLGGAVLGGALGGGAGTAAAEAAKAGTQAATQAGAQGAANAATQAATQATTSTLAQQAAAGVPAVAPPVTPPTTPPTTGGGLFGGNGGMFGFLKNMPSGLEAGAKLPAGSSFKDMYQQGLKQGVLTRAGLGSALTPSLMPGLFQKDEGDDDKKYKGRPQATPRERERYTPGADYEPGRSGEFLYFDPYPIGSNYAEGGLVRMAMGGPIEMQGGGIAELPQGDELFPRAPQAAAPRMNERELVSMTIKAVREELPEEQAAVVLAQFVQTYGEDALRKLVNDVSEGRTEGGDMEGQIEGPGDGMDDLVPAQMDDGSMDVLLSDGEFIVPADVVSGLGNGSTDAGAAELEDMMARVRQERTGMTRQPKQVAAGGLLPA